MKIKKGDSIFTIRKEELTNNFRQIPVYGLSGNVMFPGCALIVTGWKMQRQKIITYKYSKEKAVYWVDVLKTDGHGSPI